MALSDSESTGTFETAAKRPDALHEGQRVQELLSSLGKCDEDQIYHLV
jgi:hypothetical protein